ncbi:hypothetical protein EV195_102241 [Tenacibaculum skagerrakense]|uniref:DUF3298 domain-containing protein n=1 Tax=Tenacibaculum skagerrakense TaxID=186571 RepID=A0A4R2NXF7_9FLAO|nr:hypothetical protein [Tenacibaculum skagerrakense]TCP26899.1 hypothetical protein EV195_102241 [Tenacibaculum skagerrakense]
MNLKLIKKYSFSFIICFLITSVSSFSQEINEIANKMFVDMNNRDYDAILDMTHPKVFDIVPKEQMKAVLKSTFEGSNEYSIDIPKQIPEFKVSKVYKEEKDNLSYAFITYNMSMTMTFHQQTFDAQTKEMMKGVMQAKDMDVTFTSDSSMSVLMNNRMTIIMKDTATENKWVMINYDPDSPLFYKILPSTLLETAKVYKQEIMLESKKKK